MFNEYWQSPLYFVSAKALRFQAVRQPRSSIRSFVRTYLVTSYQDISQEIFIIDDLIRFWRSKVKVSIHVDAGASKYVFCFLFYSAPIACGLVMHRKSWISTCWEAVAP